MFSNGGFDHPSILSMVISEEYKIYKMEGSKKGNNTRVLRNQKLEFPILAIFKFDVCVFCFSFKLRF